MDSQSGGKPFHIEPATSTFPAKFVSTQSRDLLYHGVLGPDQRLDRMAIRQIKLALPDLRNEGFVDAEPDHRQGRPPARPEGYVGVAHRDSAAGY